MFLLIWLIVLTLDTFNITKIGSSINISFDEELLTSPISFLNSKGTLSNEIIKIFLSNILITFATPIVSFLKEFVQSYNFKVFNNVFPFCAGIICVLLLFISGSNKYSSK